MYEVTMDGVWIGNWMYWTFQIVTASNYSAIDNSHTLCSFQKHVESLLHQNLPGDGLRQRPLLPCSRSVLLATVPQAIHCTNWLPDWQPPQSNILLFWLNWTEVEVTLRPTVSRPVCLGVGFPSGPHDKIFPFCLIIVDFLIWGTLSDERMGL
jgi:hypothetical protein